jgi:hypothetical protein
VTPGAAAKGALSNGYLIFDYVSATDFKFAGVDATTGKLEIGHSNGSTWTIDASVAAGIAAGKTYSLLLSINNNLAMLILNNTTTISFTYAWRVINGVNLGLNYGGTGIGTNNSTATFDNVTVQTVIAPTTLTYQENFTGGTAKYLDAPAAGTWTIGSGSISGTAPTNGVAIVNIDLGLALGMNPGTFTLQKDASLDVSAVFKQTWQQAGIVYDMHGTGSFKFAALLVDTQQLVLGHYTTAGGWVYDAVMSYALNSGKSYTLEVIASGDVANLLINGTQMLNYTYGEDVTDGQFGLLTIKGNTTISSFTVKTSDQSFATTTIQHMDAAAAPTGPALGETSLTTAEVNTLVNPAIDRLSALLGLDAAAVAKLKSASIQVGDLPGLDLGITTGNQITLSRNAAGWGWFVDPTPNDDSEFPRATANGLMATPASPAYGKEDLLTVVEHELAHVLGYPDTASGLMSETLLAGARLATPVSKAAGQVFDEASGSFVSLREATLLRNLLHNQPNLSNTNGSSDAGTLRSNGASVLEPAPILLNKGASKTSSNSSALTGGSATPPAGNSSRLNSGLISWNKSFLGFGLSRLQSLL